MMFHVVVDWQSINSRPLPTLYDEAKVRIFVHWGVLLCTKFQSKDERFWLMWKGSTLIFNILTHFSLNTQ